MRSDFPELDGLGVVPLSSLLLHEDHDEKRLARLRQDIESDGVQANPVIVSPAGSSFLVLDGAHRVHALGLAGCISVLVQKVAPPEAAEGWQHSLCTGIDGWERALAHGLGDVELILGESDDAPEVSGIGRPVARIRTPDGQDLFAHPLEGNLSSRVDALWALRNIYPEASLVSRIEPNREYDFAGCVVVSYADFPLQEIVETVSLGSVLPAGVTRFSIPRRILGVEFPLESLRTGDAERSEKELKEIVASHIGENRLRRYDEPILLFE